MDNGQIDITSDRYLKAALQLALGFAAGGKATNWKSDNNRLLLAWHESAGKDFIPFIAPLDLEALEPVVVQWLKTADFKNEPGWFDGSTGKAWRVYNENWGHVDGNHYVFCAVEPVTAWYGK